MGLFHRSHIKDFQYSLLIYYRNLYLHWAYAKKISLVNLYKIYYRFLLLQLFMYFCLRIHKILFAIRCMIIEYYHLRVQWCSISWANRKKCDNIFNFKIIIFARIVLLQLYSVKVTFEKETFLGKCSFLEAFTFFTKFNHEAFRRKYLKSAK